MTTAIGAGSLFKGEVMKKFQRKTRRAMDALDERRGDFGRSQEQRAARDAEAIDKLFGMMGNTVRHRGKFEG